MRVPGRIAFTVACVTVVLRVGLLLHHYNPERSMLNDSSGYEYPAWSLLNSGRFLESPDPDRFFAQLYGSTPSSQVKPMFLRTPGYPLFIAGLYGLGGDRRAMILVQIFLSGLTVWFTFLLGRKVFSDWAGVLAACFVAVDPATVWCAQLVLPDSLFPLLLLVAVLLAAALIRQPLWRIAIALGVALGVTILLKPVAYYLPIPIAALLWFGRVPKRFLAGVLVPLLLFVGSWQLRNLHVIGTAAISGAQSTDLLLWRAAGVVAQQHRIDLESAQKQVIHRIPNPANLSPAELNREFFRAGGEVIRAHPILYLRDMAKGLAVVLVSPGARSFPAYFGLPAIPFVAAYVLFLLAIYAGVLVQVVSMRGQALAAIPLLLSVVAIYLIALHAGADSSCRYRVPAMPFLAIYGAAGCLRLIPAKPRKPV